MSPQPVANKKRDADKSRDELIDDLEHLRGLNTRLNRIVKRYEKAVGKDENDIFKTLLELDGQKERVESLRKELQEKQIEIERQGKELLVRNEELRIRLEEGLVKDEKIARYEELAGVNEALRESRRAELALCESEARLLLAQQVACIGTFEWNIQTGVNTWTPELEAMYGLPPGGFPGTEEAWEQLIYPEDRPEAVRRVNKAMEEGCFEGEWRVVWPDGTVHWLHGRAFVFKDGSGRPLKLIGVNIDITGRKKMEEGLRRSRDDLDVRVQERTRELSRSEEHLRMMIEASPVPMVVYEESRNYSVNKKFVETFGYTIEDIPSVNEWWPLAYPDEDYREYVKQIWYKAVDEAVKNRTSIAPQEAIVTCKDGTKKHVLCYFSSIGDLNLAIFYDLTERKRAEEALRESEEKFWVLVETTRAGIVLFRFDKFIYVNPMIEKALGYSKDELLAMNYWDIVHPDFQELVRSRGHARQQGLPVPSSYEIKALTKGGETLWAEFSAAMIDYQGQPTVIATIFDITERKRAEEELKAAKAQAELYLDLMGHDINNMHQIALGYLELARDLHPEAGDGEFLDKPIEVLQRSARLIRNVRKLQKLHDGVFQIEPVDVAKVLADVRREFGAVPDKAVMLNLNGCEHCYVRANELLHDVFANLVSNAIKHTGDRADIMIYLEVVGDNSGQYCRVSVEDNGPGVPDGFKGKIFNRILKGTDKAKGMGLGLYLVKSLVESFDGRVWVEDRVAGDHTKGARFMVMLPAAYN